MKTEIDGKCSVGTFVYARETTSPFEKYGVVVDADFWREKMKKENPAILKNFNKACESQGSDSTTPIMLLTSTVGVRMASNGVDQEEYVQNFIWTKSCYLIGFDSPKEFDVVMDLISYSVGGQSSRYIHLVRTSVKVIKEYFENPNYKTALNELFNKAFPGLKAR